MIAHHSHIRHYVILIKVPDIYVFERSRCCERPADLSRRTCRQRFRLDA
jgi:hypothetical protein